MHCLTSSHPSVSIAALEGLPPLQHSHFLRWKLTLNIPSCATQSTISGPDLWNGAYDSLLRSKVPENTVLVGWFRSPDSCTRRWANPNKAESRDTCCQHQNFIDFHLLWAKLRIRASQSYIVILLQVVREVFQTKLAVKYFGVMVDYTSVKLEGSYLPDSRQRLVKGRIL